MYYVYVLYYNSIPFYAGMTNHPFNPLNRNNGGYCTKHRIYTAVKRLPHKILSKETLQHVVDNQINILKEYGYEEHRYIDMDNPTGFGRSARYKYTKSKQLGKQKPNSVAKATGF